MATQWRSRSVYYVQLHIVGWCTVHMIYALPNLKHDIRTYGKQCVFCVPGMLIFMAASTCMEGEGMLSRVYEADLSYSMYITVIYPFHLCVYVYNTWLIVQYTCDIDIIRSLVKLVWATQPVASNMLAGWNEMFTSVSTLDLPGCVKMLQPFQQLAK